MAPNPRVKVLCVDDELNVLEGLKLHLERRFDVHTADGGAAGLELLASAGPFAVVISDMRMPAMSGAEFLARVRTHAPHTVRMLLTGQTDMESAVRAVNEGQLFRFLTKPCPPAQLVAAIDAGVEQHRLVTAEKELLELTLLGSVKVLNEVLSLAHPEAFGRAIRIKQYASELAESRRLEERWELDTAAILSQLGCVTLDRELLSRANHGLPLSAEDLKALARVPEVSGQLISHIPRLEGVREILTLLANPGHSGVHSPRGRMCADILRLAVDFDWLEARGASVGEALSKMRQSQRYDTDLLSAFEHTRARSVGTDTIRLIALAELREGMVLADDVHTTGGVLFAARGYVVTDAFVERALNFRAVGVPATLRCLVPPEHSDASAVDPEPRAA
jgi:CheY-like chemotaxis protein